MTHITAVPTVSAMLGVSRVLRGASVTNLLGDAGLTAEKERELRRRYTRRALEMLQLNARENPLVFTLTGTE